MLQCGCLHSKSSPASGSLPSSRSYFIIQLSSGGVLRGPGPLGTEGLHGPGLGPGAASHVVLEEKCDAEKHAPYTVGLHGVVSAGRRLAVKIFETINSTSF